MTGPIAWRRWIVVAALAGLAAFGVAVFADFGALGVVLGRLAPSALLAALGLSSLNYVARYVRWRGYLNVLEVRIDRAEDALIFVAGFVMSISPAKVGEVLKSLLLRDRHGVDVRITAPAVLAERVTDLLALAFWVAVTGWAIPGASSIAVAALAGVAALCMPFVAPGLAERLLDRAARLRPGAPWVESARLALRSLSALTTPRQLAVATSIAFVGWGLECASLVVLLDALGAHDTRWFEGAFIHAASTVLGAVAMLPGGLGATEAGMAAMLTTLPVPPVDRATAGAATLLVRATTLWFAVGLGALALAILARRRARHGVPTGSGTP